jgi:NAD(P)-dependent dehydrogenase (short-subunit alcohol dehydrogenase family)
MREDCTVEGFQSKVAVVTGAASGIGRALAGRCAQEGMRVVLADIDQPALVGVERALAAQGAEVLAVPTDVSQEADMQALAEKAFATFSAVHLLFNNAGVGPGRAAWANSLEDWAWGLGVNLWGVIYGIHFFVPRMLEQPADGHVVNTASMAGLLSGPGQSIYKVTKHAVVSLSETLYYDLALRDARVHVSVLCPGWVDTNILETESHRPPRFANAGPTAAASPQAQAIRQHVERALKAGMPPQAVAEAVFAAIREGRFYILTHPDWKVAVERRMQAILQERNPTLPGPARQV